MISSAEAASSREQLLDIPGVEELHEGPTTASFRRLCLRERSLGLFLKHAPADDFPTTRQLLQQQLAAESPHHSDVSQEDFEAARRGLAPYTFSELPASLRGDPRHKLHVSVSAGSRRILEDEARHILSCANTVYLARLGRGSRPLRGASTHLSEGDGGSSSCSTEAGTMITGDCVKLLVEERQRGGVSPWGSFLTCMLGLHFPERRQRLAEALCASATMGAALQEVDALAWGTFDSEDGLSASEDGEEEVEAPSLMLNRAAGSQNGSLPASR